MLFEGRLKFRAEVRVPGVAHAGASVSCREHIRTERQRKRRGPGRRTGRHQERPEGDVIWSRVFFSPRESPNLTLEEVSGTAYAALTPYRCGHSIQPSSLMQLFQYCLCPQTA